MREKPSLFYRTKTRYRGEKSKEKVYPESAAGGSRGKKEKEGL